MEVNGGGASFSANGEDIETQCQEPDFYGTIHVLRVYNYCDTKKAVTDITA